MPAFRDCREFVTHMRDPMLARLTFDHRLSHEYAPYLDSVGGPDTSAAVGGAAEGPLTLVDPARYGVATDGHLLVTQLDRELQSWTSPATRARMDLPALGHATTASRAWAIARW